MLLLINSKNFGIVRYFIFMIFFLENQTYPNTNHFDTTCIFAVFRTLNDFECFTISENNNPHFTEI